jgi:hypothetical protein
VSKDVRSSNVDLAAWFVAVFQGYVKFSHVVLVSVEVREKAERSSLVSDPVLLLSWLK